MINYKEIKLIIRSSYFLIKTTAITAVAIITVHGPGPRAKKIPNVSFECCPKQTDLTEKKIKKIINERKALILGKHSCSYWYLECIVSLCKNMYNLYFTRTKLCVIKHYNN